MIIDTSALLSYFYVGEVEHDAVTRAIESCTESLVVSPYVIAELDYLVMTHRGTRDELAILDELTSGAWEICEIDRDLLRRSTEIVRTYADTSIGIADAANIALAEIYDTRQIATLDRRHFSALRLANGSYPILLPEM